MRTFIALFIWILPLVAYPQRENELKGTTVLFGSDKNWETQWSAGLRLAEITASPCEGENERAPEPKIGSIQFLGDTGVTINTNIKENCCHSFLGEIEVVEDSILNLTYVNYGPRCACICCFGLTYVIDIYREDEYNPDMIKYVMVDNRRNTLAPINLKKK